MNKKAVMMFVLMIFLVSVMMVSVTAKDCGEIKVGEAKNLKEGCSYKYGKKTLTLDKDGKYEGTTFSGKNYHLTKEGHLYPVVKNGDGSAVAVILSNGKVQQNEVYGDFGPSDSKGGAVGAGTGGKNNKVIRVNGERQVIDRGIHEQAKERIAQCVNGKIKCTFKGKKVTIADTTYTAVGKDTVMTQGPEGITIGGKPAPHLPDDVVKVLETGSASVSGSGDDLQISYQTGTKGEKITFQNRGAYWLKEEAGKEGTKQTYYAGGKPINVDKDGRAQYDGNEYEVTAKGNELILEDSDEKITFSADGTISKKDGDVETKTKVQADGTRIESTYEKGKLIGGKILSKDGKIIAEQDAGNTRGTVFYDSKGEVRGFGSIEGNYNDPKYQWRPDNNGCSGSADDPKCYRKWKAGSGETPEKLQSDRAAAKTAYETAQTKAQEARTKANVANQRVTQNEQSIQTRLTTPTGPLLKKAYDETIKTQVNKEWSEVEKDLSDWLSPADRQFLQGAHKALQEQKQLETTAQGLESTSQTKKGELDALNEKIPGEGGYEKIDAFDSGDQAAIEEAAENGIWVGLSDRQELYGRTEAAIQSDFFGIETNADLAGFLGSAHSISTIPLMNEFEGYNRWVEDVDRYFAANYLGSEYVESAICRAWYDPIETGKKNGVAMIETAAGRYQAAAHIQAQRRASGALLCNEDEDGQAICPDNLECREDGLCYNERGQPQQGFQYLITFGVRAPYDDEFLSDGRVQGRVEEDQRMVSFNIEIREKKGVASNNYLFATDTGRGPGAIILGKGQSSEAIIPPTVVDYSSKDIQEVCVVWGDAPKTLSYGLFGSGIGGDGGGLNPVQEVPSICTDVITGDEITTRGRAVSSSTQPTSKGQVRFCTFSGCQ